MNFFKKLSHLIRLAIKNPGKSLSNLNVRNLRTLLSALKYEDSSTISQNFSNLIDNKQESQITQIVEHKPILKPKQMVRKTPDKKSDLFYTQWDDSYIEKHIDQLNNYSSPSSHIKGIAIIADLNLPQCKKYRVLQKVEVLRSKGIHCDFSHWLDVPRSLNLMQNVSCVLFYRVPFSKLTSSYIDEATRLDLNIGYDIDDPIFDKEIYKSNRNLDFLPKNERAQLLNNTKHYASIIRQCHFLTTSTPYMAEVLRKYSKASIYIWRNLMDAQTLNAVDVVQNLAERSLDPDKFVIGYMSGSRAHEADFKEAIAALDNILANYEYTELRVVGYADLVKKLKVKYKDRITHSPFSDYYQYMESFLEFDINIIPLVQNQFNECKSAIRYLESSLLNTASVISYIGDFKHIVKHKDNGIFVHKNSTKEWIKTLEWCLSNRTELKQIAKRANANVLENYTTKTFTSNSINDQIILSEI